MVDIWQLCLSVAMQEGIGLALRKKKTEKMTLDTRDLSGAASLMTIRKFIKTDRIVPRD